VHKATFAILLNLIAYHSFAQNINENRIAFYSFSNNASDNSGSSDGIVYGAMLTTDRFNNSNSAYYFDGSSAYIEIPHNDQFNFGVNDDFTISLWLYIADIQANLNGNNNEILGKWSAFNNQGYPFAIRYWNYLAPSDNKKRLFLARYDTEICNHAPRTQSPCELISEKWYHIVYLKEGSELRLYQNGTLVDRITDNTSTNCSTKNSEPILIGKRQANQRHFKGKVDDISFYNRAISEEEIHLLLTEGGWAPQTLSNETDFISYSIPEESEPSTIDKSNHLINIKVPCGTDITNLIAEFNISGGATAEVNGIIQESGKTPNDFTNGIEYILTSESGCMEETWFAEIQFESFNQSKIDDITAFSLFNVKNQIGESIINLDQHSINLNVKCYTDLKQLIPEFAIPNNATAFINNQEQISGHSQVDFSSEVIYTVKSSNECAVQNWTIFIHKKELTSEKADSATMFISFTLPNQIGTEIIDLTNHSITVTVNCESDLSKIKPNYTVPTNTTIEINHLNIQDTVDFTSPVIYTVTSTNTCTTSDWTVTVNKNTDTYQPFVPNIITPNEDARNDKWVIKTSYDIPLKVEIFNRWGELVYKNDSYDNSWSGQHLPAGVYYYQLDENDCMKELKGWVTIMR